jgi:hypothetical protein
MQYIGKCKWRALIHELPTIGSFTEARNFQLIMLIWIKQVIIPVHAQIKHMLITRIKYPRTSDEREKERDSFEAYVSSSPAETFVLAMRTIRFSTSPTLIILA